MFVELKTCLQDGSGEKPRLFNTANIVDISAEVGQFKRPGLGAQIRCVDGQVFFTKAEYEAVKAELKKQHVQVVPL
jgi:hypothetical protein